MTKEVVIGGQVIKLRATGSLPLAYRLMFNRDMLQDVDNWREQLREKLEQDEALDAAAVEASAQDAAAETPSDSANQILYTMDIAMIARLAYCMAKSAEPSIPDSMTAWLDTFDDPNALYVLTGHVLQLYNNGFETTVNAKKNIPPQLEK